MGFKNVLNAVLAMLLVFALWLLAVKTFFPPPPRPEPTAATSQPTTQEAPPSEPPVAAAPERAEPTTAAASQPTCTVAEAPQQRQAELGSAEDDPDRPFPMKITFTTQGAAISEILLSDYDEKVPEEGQERVPYRLLDSVADDQTGRVHNAMATESVALFAGEADEGTIVALDQANWSLTEQTDETVAFETTVACGGRPLLRLDKRYELRPQPRKGGRHDVNLSLTFENLDDKPVSFSARLLGPIGMQQAMLRFDDRHIYAAYTDGQSVKLTLKKHRSVVKGDIPWPVSEDGRHLLWTAIDNQYFTCIVAAAAEGTKGFSDLLARVEATHVTSNEGLAARADMTPRLVMSRQTLQPGQDVTLNLQCYFGPKSRSIFQNQAANPDYAARHYVLLIERNYPWCTFAWLTNGMIALLMFFGQKVFGNFGLAIIVLVLIVRTILHPLTKKGQVNMAKMQKQMATLQPKLQEVKKKYANDKAKLQEENMKVYREAGVSPAGQMMSCLPMFLQMPIWVALWASLSNTIEMRHAPFMLWIRDLTAPDALISFTPFTVPVLSGMIGEVRSLNILPILLAITMYFQQRFMPKAARAEKKKDMTPDQLAQQQKIMNVMMVFFGVLFYNAPSGLTLYIMASNVFGMIEQWRIRQHIRREEATGAVALPVQPKPKRTSWLARLEKMADQAKKHQPRAKRKRV